jgi:hypothetical protein
MIVNIIKLFWIYAYLSNGFLINVNNKNNIAHHMYVPIGIIVLKVAHNSDGGIVMRMRGAESVRVCSGGI